MESLTAMLEKTVMEDINYLEYYRTGHKAKEILLQCLKEWLMFAIPTMTLVVHYDFGDAYSKCALAGYLVFGLYLCFHNVIHWHRARSKVLKTNKEYFKSLQAMSDTDLKKEFYGMKREFRHCYQSNNVKVAYFENVKYCYSRLLKGEPSVC